MAEKDQSRILPTATSRAVANVKKLASGFLSDTASNSPYASVLPGVGVTGGYADAGAAVAGIPIPGLADFNAAFGTGSATGAAPSTDNPGAMPNEAPAPMGLVESLFLRGVIIVLGFIFVAVGLSMFKSSEISLPKLSPLPT